MTSDEGEVTQSTIDTIDFHKEKGVGNPISSSEARRMTRIAAKAEQAAFARLLVGSRGRLTAAQNNLIAFGGIVAKTEALIAHINGEDQETLVAEEPAPVEDVGIADASLSEEEFRELSTEIHSMKNTVGFKAYETRLYLSGGFQGDLQAEGMADWYRDLPLAGRKAFLSVWRGGEYSYGEMNLDEWEVGKLLFDHTHRSDLSLAVAKAYAEHPKEVEEFAKVARQTYVVGEEYASNGEIEPAGPGNGNFTWEGMFGWIETNNLFGESNANSNMPLDKIYNGLVFAFEAYTEESSEAQSLEQFTTLSPNELEGEFRVEIQTHPVADLPAFSEPHHLSLRIVPVDPQGHDTDPRFILQDNGSPAFTIGAGSSDVKLTARFNRKSDVDTTNGKQFTFLQMPAHFLSSADWVTALVNATIMYKNDKKYEIFSNSENNQFTSPGYNSNSFIAGLLVATGTELPDVDNIFTDSYYPGWDNPLPIE